MATKQFSPAQLAAQKLFAERARAGTLKKGKRKTTRKANPGLYENINAKKKRIAAGSGEKMRKPGEPGRPTAKAFEQSAMTAKRNPDKAKPKAYVRRASQATGAPPSKRLVTRRKKALTAPAGYFPNPKTKKAATLQDRVKKFKAELNFDKFKTFKKVVGYYPSDSSPDYELVALFQTQAQAVNAAESYAENYPKYRWFVKGL